MKVFVVFGSTSDDNVQGPLVKGLQADFEVESAVISAHRDLEKLQQKISTWKGDAIVAGAGLAAALPGVVAAMTRIPVFGVPVPSQFGGLDSFASIAQMPPGVPVLTCGPHKTGEIGAFLKNYRALAGKPFGRVHFVSAEDHPEIAGLIDKAKPAAEEAGLSVSRGDSAAKDAFNVFLASKPQHVSKEFGLHLPFFPQSDVSTPASYLAAVNLAEQGGLWVGANNTRNAVHAAIRLRGAAKLLQEKAA